jgi:hypothetical protein
VSRETQRPRRSSEAVTQDPGRSVTDQGSARPELLEHHRQLLIDRGLNELTIAARGYSSTVMPGWLRQVGFSIEDSKRTPGLVIPIRDVHGDPAFYQYRPDTPRERDGKAVKYAMPVKVRMVLDAPLPTQHKLDDVSVPLWVTEAPIKADAIVSAGGTAVATFGVWGFKGRRPRGGASTMLPDWEWIALQGRTVYLVPDSDVASNKHVRDAVTRLGLALDSRGADVRYCYVPGTADGAKRGVDDYLAGGGTLDGLMETADDTPPSGSRAPGGSVIASLFDGADDRFTDARMAETVAEDVMADRFIWVAGLGWQTWDGQKWASCSDVTVAEAVRTWTLERFAEAVTNLQAGKGDQKALDGWRGCSTRARSRR